MNSYSVTKYCSSSATTSLDTCIHCYFVVSRLQLIVDSALFCYKGPCSYYVTQGRKGWFINSLNCVIWDRVKCRAMLLNTGFNFCSYSFRKCSAISNFWMNKMTRLAYTLLALNSNATACFAIGSNEDESRTFIKNDLI